MGRARLNSRQRKNVRRVKQTLDENEGRPGEVLRSDAERPMMRFDRFETGLGLSTERWSRGNATASEGEELGSVGGDTRTGRGQEMHENASPWSVVSGASGTFPVCPGFLLMACLVPGPSRRDRDDTLDCSKIHVVRRCFLERVSGVECARTRAQGRERSRGEWLRCWGALLSAGRCELLSAGRCELEQWRHAGAVVAARSAVMSRGARAGVKELVGSCDFRRRCGGPVRVPAVHVWFSGSQSSSCSSPVAKVCVVQCLLRLWWAVAASILAPMERPVVLLKCLRIWLLRMRAHESSRRRTRATMASADIQRTGAMVNPGNDLRQHDLSVVPVQHQRVS